MSYTVLKLIPIEPDFIPGETMQNRAAEMLGNIFKSSEIELIETDEIEFADQGQNFENVSCNLCSRKIDMEFWQEVMDTAHDTRFEDLTFMTPCCHKRTSLNDLNYDMPAGFSKFVISIADPLNDVQSNTILALENILGTKVRKIWAHY
jgi:hypothetical protein